MDHGEPRLQHDVTLSDRYLSHGRRRADTITLRAYYILAKPGIIYGNSLSVIGGYFFGARQSPDIAVFIATLAGVGLTIAAGCVLNNIIDRPIDGLMKRTKSRPLVTGEISTTQAVAYALSTSVVGIGLLAFYVNVLTALLGIFALFAYVVLYGYAKRRSYHGTLVGSISGSMPLVAGYTAATGELDTTAAMLFIVMALWQVPHFYAIAIYRKEEYAAAKLPIISVSKSIRLAVLSMKWYVAAFLLSVWTLWLVAEGSGYIYLAVITIVSALWLVKCFQRLGDTSRWAKGVFRWSLIVLLVFNALIATWQILP